MRQRLRRLTDSILYELHREMHTDTPRGADQHLFRGNRKRLRGDLRHPPGILVSVQSGTGIGYAAVCNDRADFL